MMTHRVKIQREAIFSAYLLTSPLVLPNAVDAAEFTQYDVILDCQMPQKIFLFDVDGVLIRNDGWTKNIERDCRISHAQLQEFFDRDFGSCLEDRTDLKVTLEPWLSRWRYNGSSDDFLKYWFEADSNLNHDVLKLAMNLSRSFPCYLATNQEKYRASYLMNELNFKDTFLDIFSACHFKAAKPSNDFFFAMLVQLKKLHPEVGVESMFFVDDSIRNVTTARRLGIQAHHFRNIESFAKWLESVTENPVTI